MSTSSNLFWRVLSDRALVDPFRTRKRQRAESQCQIMQLCIFFETHFLVAFCAIDHDKS